MSGARNQVYLDNRSARTKERILAAIKESPRSGATLAKDLELSDRTVLLYLKGLAEAGTVKLDSRGRSSVWVLA